MNKMNNGNSGHDFDSIIELLRKQHAVLDVLLRHLARVEAMVFAVSSHTLTDDDLRIVKRLKDHTYEKIWDDIIAEVKRELGR